MRVNRVSDALWMIAAVVVLCALAFVRGCVKVVAMG